MNHRNDQGGTHRGPGHSEHPRDRGHYASREYEDMASLTNRQWGPARTDGQSSFGQQGLGGYGDFTDREGHGDNHRGDNQRGEFQRGQGGYGEDQGRHAQSGHGRGGSQYAQQQRETSRGPEPASQRGRGPRNYQRPDARIADDLIDRLTDDEQLDASEILIMVENGAVTLTGEVEARWMKHRAEDIASDVTGVRDINNRLVVDTGVSAFGPRGQAVRSGSDQRGSGFSSSARIADPASETSTRSGRAGPESESSETAGRSSDSRKS